MYVLVCGSIIFWKLLMESIIFWYRLRPMIMEVTVLGVRSLEVLATVVVVAGISSLGY